MRSSRGFTLQEVLVAIVIAGILLAIGVPNWTRYVNKSKQSEAKANLTSLYSAEKAFFFENAFYNPRLDGVGFRPEGRLDYRVGFGVDSGAPGSPNCNHTGQAANCTTVTGYTATWTESASASGTTIPNTAVANATTFNAEARGIVNGNAADVWLIDLNKSLTNTSPNLD